MPVTAVSRAASPLPLSHTVADSVVDGATTPRSRGFAAGDACACAAASAAADSVSEARARRWHERDDLGTFFMAFPERVHRQGGSEANFRAFPRESSLESDHHRSAHGWHANLRGRLGFASRVALVTWSRRPAPACATRRRCRPSGNCRRSASRPTVWRVRACPAVPSDPERHPGCESLRQCRRRRPGSS